MVLGICRRTVAVSKGYLTRVFVVDNAAPEKNPDIVSEIVSLLPALDKLDDSLETDGRVIARSRACTFSVGNDESASTDRKEVVDFDKNSDLVILPSRPD